MYFLRCFSKLGFIFSMVVFCIFAEEMDLLRMEHIQDIMNQILQQHVNKTEMTSSIIAQSFKIYIDQFDPEKMYLLSAEVKPFISPTQEQLNQYLQEYKNNDFSSYKKLDLLIQATIERSRQWRENFKEELTPLFQAASKHRSYRQWGEKDHVLFADNFSELKSRMRADFIEFIEEQNTRFGPVRLADHKEKILEMYEAEIHDHEDAYVAHSKETSMSEADQEHHFALHVLKALAQSLDSHTRFFNNSEAYDMRVRLEKGYAGTGLIFKDDLDGPIVVSLMPDSPAEKNGKVQIGDMLVAIDRTPVSDLSFEKTMELLRGESGTSVVLTLKRNGSPFDITLVRESLIVDQDRVITSYESFGDGIIGMISLKSFYQNQNGISSEKDVRHAIQYLQEQGSLRGLVLDLRENTGGYLTQAVKVAGLFITNGVVVISKYHNGEMHYYRDIDGRVFYTGPLVILSSRITASAAEIVAQALQDYGVALVVGDSRTYGKGSIQSQTITDSKVPLFFKVTVGKYYTVSGKTPQNKGVLADIVVPTQHIFDQVGEEYLDYPLSEDTIKPAYNDNLTDVHPDLSGWFLKYYVPNLQLRKSTWRDMLPILKKNSEYRLAHNRDYQIFFDSVKAGTFPEPLKARSANPRYQDMQLQESISILKDMFLLQSNFGETKIGAPTP